MITSRIRQDLMRLEGVLGHIQDDIRCGLVPTPAAMVSAFLYLRLCQERLMQMEMATKERAA